MSSVATSPPAVPPKASSRDVRARVLDPMPLPWHVFFGIVEPISVAAGAIYAICFQANYNAELVPPAFLAGAGSVLSTASNAREPFLKSVWPALAHKTSQSLHAATGAALSLSPATSMALGQLGSCYILAMLHSSLMLWALRRYVSHDAATYEALLRCFFIVLAVADWTHIGLTLYLLPSPEHGWVGTAHKLALLANPANWNSLLFGNVIITFSLFTARALWWVGVGRRTNATPDVPARKGSKAL